MSGGSHEREHRLDVQCKHCGRFYRNDGIHAHEENCPFDAVDATVVPLEGQRGEGDVSPSGDLETSDPPQDGRPAGADPVGGRGDDPVPSEAGDALQEESEDVVDDADQEAATDGGPLPVPEPDVDVDDQDDGGDDPDPEVVARESDRYVLVDQYVDEVRSRADRVDAGRLEASLSEFDVVDVVETDEESISAYTFEQIT